VGRCIDAARRIGGARVSVETTVVRPPIVPLGSSFALAEL
jgi:hypothetical protein